jgi:hypothetical protein
MISLLPCICLLLRYGECTAESRTCLSLLFTVESTGTCASMVSSSAASPVLQQNTRYDGSVKTGYFAFVNTELKVGKYKAGDIFNIDETNVDFDLVSGTTLAGSGVER